MGLQRSPSDHRAKSDGSRGLSILSSPRFWRVHTLQIFDRASAELEQGHHQDINKMIFCL